MTETANTKKLLFILSKEPSIEILKELGSKEWATASEIANSLKIHIATAVKYLGELAELGILEKRIRKTKTIDAYEYCLKNKKFNIKINLEDENKENYVEIAKTKFVREKPENNATYEFDDEQQKILKVDILSKGIRKRVLKTIKLSNIQGKFLWNLPYGSQNFKSVYEICNEIGIKEIEIPEVMKLVRILEDEEILEVKE